MSHHHDLKLQPQYFEAKLRGLKPWEIRSTEDRSFAMGDTVTFLEYNPALNQYSGREIGPCSIVYMLCGCSMLPNGVVIFTHSPSPATQQ